MECRFNRVGIFFSKPLESLRSPGCQIPWLDVKILSTYRRTHLHWSEGGCNCRRNRNKNKQSLYHFALVVVLGFMSVVTTSLLLVVCNESVSTFVSATTEANNAVYTL